MASYNCEKHGSKEEQRLEMVSTLLKVVSDKNKLKILCYLNKGERCVCKITGQTKTSQSLTSHHLRKLKTAGLISNTKDGQYVKYRLTDYGKTVTKKLLSL